MKIGCFTPVKSRQLMLRTCILQMQAQTRVPDTHLILINGKDAMNYEARPIEDLLSPSLQLKAYPYDSTTSELAVQCLKLMLEQNIDVFCKIDSDDLYHSNYIETVIKEIREEQSIETETAFAYNLIDQLVLTTHDNSEVKVTPAGFYQGLGLPDHEIEKGIKVGAPPTYVFNRSAAKLIVDNASKSEYHHLESDDAMMRNLLFDNGVVIQQLKTKRPVFGYVIHGSNISNPG